MGKGMKEMSAGNYSAAKNYMTKAVRILPNPFIHSQLGNVNYFMGDYVSAIADYRVSLGYSGDVEPEILNNMAAAYLQLKDYGKAAEYKRRSMEAGKISGNID